MKRSVCFLLLLCMLCAVLFFCASCSSSGGEQSTADTTGVVKLPAAEKIVEYDSEGNFIITPADNRKVYPTDEGYVVFCFENNTVKKIQTVTVCESAEDAARKVIDYYAENGTDGVAVFASGEYFISGVPYGHEYFEYYTMTKDQVIAQFEGASN